MHVLRRECSVADKGLLSLIFDRNAGSIDSQKAAEKVTAPCSAGSARKTSHSGEC